MTMKKKKNFSIKRVGEIMDNLDTPHGDFDLGDSFQQKGASGPPGPRPVQSLLNSFRNTFEQASSEHFAQELFSMGRLREYFQAWIIPKMPDPLPVYVDELEYMGFPVRTSFDGTPCIMVRYRGYKDVEVQEVTEEDTKTVPAYTDDWADDMSDIPNPFEEPSEQEED